MVVFFYIWISILSYLTHALLSVPALRQGGRWPFYFFATIFHGFTVEFMAYFFPHIDNFWHAQGVITLVERRMPFYIIFLCIYFQIIFTIDLRELTIVCVFRYCILLPWILGCVQAKVEIGLCRVSGCWCVDRAD